MRCNIFVASVGGGESREHSWIINFFETVMVCLSRHHTAAAALLRNKESSSFAV